VGFSAGREAMPRISAKTARRSPRDKGLSRRIFKMT
jgi:hypothetical protein